MLRRYRLNSATIGVGNAQGSHPEAILLPAGAVIAASFDVPPASAIEANHQTAVVWEGQALTIFTRDLLDRGEPLDDAMSQCA